MSTQQGNAEKAMTTKNRNTIRNGIFGRSQPKSKVIDFFGEDVELRQPTMKALLSMTTNEEDVSRRASMMIVNLTFIPGTNDKVFDPGDVDRLQEMPFGEDMKRMNDAINELTGTQADVVEAAVKNSEATSTD